MHPSMVAALNARALLIQTSWAEAAAMGSILTLTLETVNSEGWLELNHIKRLMVSCARNFCVFGRRLMLMQC